MGQGETTALNYTAKVLGVRQGSDSTRSHRVCLRAELRPQD